MSTLLLATAAAAVTGTVVHYRDRHTTALADHPVHPTTTTRTQAASHHG